MRNLIEDEFRSSAGYKFEEFLPAMNFGKVTGTSSFLDNSNSFTTALQGMRTNLYKDFIVRSWDLLDADGVGGLLHPEGPYDDARGGKFRAAYYKRRLKCPLSTHQ